MDVNTPRQQTVEAKWGEKKEDEVFSTVINALPTCSDLRPSRRGQQETAPMVGVRAEG
jgi:hypothetical protein